MDVDGDLGSQLVRQVLQHLPLIHCFLIGPQEVKPLDHSLLQVFSDLERGQEGGGGVKFRPEVASFKPTQGNVIKLTINQLLSKLLTFRKLMYCLMASMRAWKLALAAFMLVIIEPTLPTMVAKINTPTWRRTTWNKTSRSVKMSNRNEDGFCLL